MIVNILRKDNGVGLTRDGLILKAILESNGVEVNFYDPNIHANYKRANINIHLEHVYQRAFLSANKNIFFPNPEWFQSDYNRLMHKIDLVCCKTFDCHRIFKEKHINAVYTGFTSIDRYNGNDEKIRAFIHCAGQSSYKHTQEVYRAWNDEFSKLIILSKNYKFVAKENIYTTNWIPENKLVDLQNKVLIHICPSCYEGFGHYINEALSCGAVVVTTDADPMREFVQNGNGFLVKPSGTIHKDLAIMHSVRSESINEVIRQIESTDENTLVKMGQAGRELFLRNDKLFNERFLQLISEL